MVYQWPMGENLRPLQTAGASRPVSVLVPLSLICVLGTLWGASASLAKLAVLDGIQPLGFTLWNAMGAGIIMLAICHWKGVLPRVTAEHVRYYAICGVLGVALPNLNIVVVVGHIPAGVVAVALSTTPIMTYAITLLWRLERFDRIRATGLSLALVGTLFIVLPRTSLPQPGAAPWFAMALLTPVLYAVTNVLADRMRPAGSPSIMLAAGMLVVSTVALAPFAFAFDQVHPLAPPFTAGDYAVLAQIGTSVLAYFLFFEILRMVGAVQFSVTAYVITLTGIGWGILFFAETHSLWIWAAVAFIFAGLALVTAKQGAVTVRQPSNSAP